MARPTLVYVTQVAPYRNGPAGVHGVLDQSARAWAELAESAGLGFHRIEDVRSVDAATVVGASVVVLFTIGETPWNPEQRVALLEAVRAGTVSVVAVHSATDACFGWDEYGSLVGARFDGHPWTQWCTLDVVDTAHPAVAHLGPTWHWRDEIYRFRDLRPDAHVLLRAREGELDPELAAGAPAPSFGYPLSWCFTEGDGRVFSTSLGHFPLAWETPDYLRHLAGGLEWSMEGPG